MSARRFAPGSFDLSYGREKLEKRESDGFGLSQQSGLLCVSVAYRCADSRRSQGLLSESETGLILAANS